jgi:phosphoribosylglycinamide formyltransferase-1
MTTTRFLSEDGVEGRSCSDECTSYDSRTKRGETEEGAAYPERIEHPGVTDFDPKKRLAVLLSGRGSNFRAIADAVETGVIPETEIVAVISDVPGAAGLESARERGLPAHAVDRRRFDTRREHEAEILRLLEEARPDLVCLAGYMRVLSPDFVARFRGRILNIHPALLPKFPGLHAQRRALEAGETVSGCTVHFVNEGVDAGPVILQRRVPVLPGDTEGSLSDRILSEEHRAYPEAIALVLSGGAENR